MKRICLKLFALIMALTAFSGAADVKGTKITGTGAVVTLSSRSHPVLWVQLVAPSTNAANVVWGDCTVTSSANGSILPAGAGQFMPPNTPGGYDLTQVCAYIANADVLYVAWSEQ